MPITRETVLNTDFQALGDDEKLAVLQRLDTGFAVLDPREQRVVLTRLPTQATATDLGARELRRSGLEAAPAGATPPLGEKRSLAGTQKRAIDKRRRASGVGPLRASAAQLRIEPPPEARDPLDPRNAIIDVGKIDDQRGALALSNLLPTAEEATETTQQNARDFIDRLNHATANFVGPRRPLEGFPVPNNPEFNQLIGLLTEGREDELEALFSGEFRPNVGEIGEAGIEAAARSGNPAVGGVPQTVQGLRGLATPGKRVKGATRTIQGTANTALSVSPPFLAQAVRAAFAAQGIQGVMKLIGLTGAGVATGEVANVGVQKGLTTLGASEDVAELGGTIADVVADPVGLMAGVKVSTRPLRRLARSPKPTAEPAKPSPSPGKTSRGPLPAPDKTVRTTRKLSDARKAKAKTARGTEIETEFDVVDVRELVTSNLDDLRENPAFPQELQPRDRTRRGSELDPELLAENISASEGAPIIGPENIVESGNARSIAVRRAFNKELPSAEKVRDFLRENSERFGIPRSQVEGIERPVLVRRRKTDVDRVQFAREANESAVSTFSARETAEGGAKLLDTELLQDFQPSETGDLTTAANSDFVRGFMQKVVSPTDRAQLVDKTGALLKRAFSASATRFSPKPTATRGPSSGSPSPPTRRPVTSPTGCSARRPRWPV